MSDSVQQWLLQLGLLPLPAMEATCAEIQNLLQCPTANYTQFTDIIKHDPGFSLAALRTINSAHYKNKTPIVDIGLAIPLLGMTWLENTAATLPRINNQYSETQYKGVTHCYSLAIHASYYAFYLATQQKNPRASEIASVALLNNIGEMMLWVNPSPIAQKIQSLTAKGTPINEAVISCLDITMDKLNDALRQQWNLASLDPLLWQPDHTNLERKIYVDLAYKISLAAEDDWHHNTTLKALKLTAEYLNTNPDKLISKIHSITAEIAHKIDPMDLPCSAFNLLSIPQKTEQGSTTTTETQPQEKQTCESKITLSPIKQQPSASSKIEIQNQANTKPDSINPTHQLISRTMHDIQKQDGLSRVVFIMLTRDRKQLIARTTIDNGAKSKIEQFRTNTSKHDLFSILLRKPKAIWMNSEKLVEYVRLIPQQTYSLLESENFFAMSLFSKTRAIGLIYADNGTNSTALDKATYHNFKRLCQRISNELKQQ